MHPAPHCPTPVRARTRRRRAGVSLVEIAIVVAIFGIMAALAAQSMAGLLPSWRTKEAAKDFNAYCQQARDLAIAEGVEYRVRVDLWDTDLAGGNTNTGSYYVERGSLAYDTETLGTWDILPMDENGVVNDSEGHHEFTRDTANALPWVSLEEPTVKSIIFDARGFLENPSTDFDSGGMVNFKFWNKRALIVDGTNEWWEVSVSRAGFSRLSGTYSTAIGSAAGTASTTNFGTSSGAGYTGGSVGP